MAIQSTLAQIRDASKTAAEQSGPKDSKNALGKNEFLKLLTTQMQHQDPTQPMDSTAFVAQLAQFSTLEQMSNTNDTLTKMLTAQGSALQTTAASFIGKSAVFKTDEVALTEGKPATIAANLSQAAANVVLSLQGADGKVVRTIGLGARPSGNNSFQWDGRDDSGTPLASGPYTINLQAADLGGKSIPLTVHGSALITGVVFNNGTPSFTAGGTSLQLSEISELNE